VPDTTASEAEVATGKLEKCRLSGVEEIPAELFKKEGKNCVLGIHEIIKLIWNKELLHQWEDLIVVPIHKKGDITDCSNYRGMSFLST
jgi:hypothetical protein